MLVINMFKAPILYKQHSSSLPIRTTKRSIFHRFMQKPEQNMYFACQKKCSFFNSNNGISADITESSKQVFENMTRQTWESTNVVSLSHLSNTSTPMTVLRFFFFSKEAYIKFTLQEAYFTLYEIVKSGKQFSLESFYSALNHTRSLRANNSQISVKRILKFSESTCPLYESMKILHAISDRLDAQAYASRDYSNSISNSNINSNICKYPIVKTDLTKPIEIKN